MRKIVLAFALILLTGCGSYVPTVSLTWTAAPNCNVTPCGYVIYRATVASGVKACPPTTGTAYTALNQTKPVSGTSYKDSTAKATVV